MSDLYTYFGIKDEQEENEIAIKEAANRLDDM